MKRKLTATKVQPFFNAFIRRRDSKDGHFICISCGKKKTIAFLNAGHYVPVGRSSFLRFSEDNTNGECSTCNGFDKFHLVGYRKNLIKKIGLKGVEWLEENSRILKQYKQFELQEIQENYKNKLSVK